MSVSSVSRTANPPLNTHLAIVGVAPFHRVVTPSSL